MAVLLSHIVSGEHFILSNERTLFWESERTLIIADLHVGKTGHFRKAGIGVPAGVYKDDLHRLLTGDRAGIDTTLHVLRGVDILSLPITPAEPELRPG